jgi:toxin ParE1/3/4
MKSCAKPVGALVWRTGVNFRITAKADEDIVGIYAYGARRFGAAQAERYHAGLIQCFAFLAEHPLPTAQYTSTQHPAQR